MNQIRIKINSAELNTLFNQGTVKTFKPNGEVDEVISVLDNGNIKIKGFTFYTPDGSDFKINILNTSSKVTVEDTQFENNFLMTGVVRNEVILKTVNFFNNSEIASDCLNLSLLNCIVPGLMTVSGDYKVLTVVGGTFTHLQITMSQQHNASVSDLIVNQGLAFQGGTTGSVEIGNVKVNDLILQLANLNKFYVGGYSEVKKLHYGKSNIASVFIAHSTIEHSEPGAEKIQSFKAEKATFKGMLVVNLTRTHIDFNLQNCNVAQLSASGKLTGLFEINDCDFNKLFFVNFQNAGEMKIVNLRLAKQGSLSIRLSNLGKAEIHESDFAEGQFSFEKSQINEIFISETDFPKKVYLNDKLNYGQGKLAYGQLQTVFQRQGDTIRSYEYLSREIESHYNELRLFSKHFFTTINLAFNFWSNDFGRSWSRGVFFTMMTGFLFFLCLIISTVQYQFAATFNWDWTFLGSYLKFMNPLRHFETEALFAEQNIKRISLTNLSYVWDFVGRIFVAYGYYQTIQAFRKFGRR